MNKSSEIMAKHETRAAPEAALVSVIIPCYNQAHYLGEAIESVLNQSYRHFEIVVVDDGSTDNTAEVAAGYSEVKLLRQQNQGLPGARNSGLRESRGEYLVFLDSDDRLLPDALLTGVEALSAHPEYAFVSGHCQSIGPDGSALGITQSPCSGEENYLVLLSRNYIWTPGAVMFRRSVIEQAGGFNASLDVSEDYDLYLRIAKDLPVHCHEQRVLEYRQHEKNMTAGAARMLKGVLRVHRRHRPFVKGNKRYEEAFRAGKKFWKEYYGGRLVNQVRARVRGREELDMVARDLLILLRYHPREFFTHAYRKLYCILFRVDSDLIEG
jgi:glycosyltransferase involved in cell wall biosynthesis